MFHGDAILSWVSYLAPTIIGFLLGLALGVWRAGRPGGSGRPRVIMAIWLSGLLVSHLVEVAVFSPQLLSRDPSILLQVWSHNSTAWGFPVALGLVVWLGRKDAVGIWRIGDDLIYGFVPGWMLVRLGCTFAFDHVGERSDFFLAMDYPIASAYGLEEGARHNLGLYELLLMLVILVSHRLWSRRETEGRTFLWVLSGYAVGRFALEFLQAREMRYAGLTLVQLAMLGLAVAAVVLWRKRLRSEGSSPVASVFD